MATTCPALSDIYPVNNLPATAHNGGLDPAKKTTAPMDLDAAVSITDFSAYYMA